MTLADAILPGLALAVAWLGRRAGAETPPATRYPGPSDIPWPAAPPPTTTSTAPPPRPMTPDERITDVGPIDPTTDQPRETPPMQRGMPGTSAAIDRAIRRAKQRASSGGGWRPAQRPTRSEVERAKQLLAPGVWREGVIESSETTQYRGAWHPDRSGSGRHKGVEVWHRATG